MKTTLKKFTNSGIKNFRIMAFTTAIFAAGSMQAQTYCAPVPGDCSDADEITNVTFAGINNNSTCGSGYSDFSASVAPAQVIAGQTYSLSATVPAHFGNESVAAWIDFNNNGTFEATEFFYLGLSPAAGSTLTTQVGIPVTASGTVRLRLKAQFSQAITATAACTAPYLEYGEFEDYSVTITPNTVCSGTPVVGAPTSSVANACVGAAFTLTAAITPAAGLSYQWQSSTDSGTTWANLGASQTTNTYSVLGQAVPTSYRIIVTCSGSGLSATSTSVAVGQNVATQCYCTNAINFDCTDGDLITNVSFNSINNTTACGNATTGYTSYVATIPPANLVAGTTESISVTVGSGFANESVGVWIDYNQNGTFEASEYTYVGTGSGAVLTQSVVIPETALDGVTRMRVVVAAAAATSFTTAFSCGPLTAENYFGEMEDYAVDIEGVLATPTFNATNFNLYPNPTTGIVNLKFGTATAVNAINIYSVSGQLVYTKNYSSSSDNYSIDLQSAAAGVYIVKVQTENGTQINRLVKN